jgi:hypothetical protein
MDDRQEARQEAYEKLGAFYLGRLRDPATGERRDDLLLYDSRDLTTHGVIIGMTGSGKTGLAIGLLEEAAMDRIPVIAIDPKGDLANLLLTFPDLAPEDFRPWVNEDVARQKGQEPDDFAREQAELWRKGLEGWGQDGDRIRRMREQADLAIYTPGSAAGRQVSVLRSFAVPSAAVLADPDALRDRIQSTVTSLLALMGIQADPIRSREHILLSTFSRTRGNTAAPSSWAAHRGDPAPALHPRRGHGARELLPVEGPLRPGAPVERAPRVARDSRPGWRGSRSTFRRSCTRPTGSRGVTIFSIAHLSRRRAHVLRGHAAERDPLVDAGAVGHVEPARLVYMDEIFGFFPPTANPPSKAPMLTLLKQARAFGVGMLLATQNPVDLDYKGLGNTGSWFIGRLQTERDKARIMDALQGAMAGSNPLSRGELDRLISGLGQRVFLLHNVHERAPVLFETRWVMSYLAGPMTLQQLRTLAREGDADRAGAGVGAGVAPAAPVAGMESPVAPGALGGGEGAAAPPATPPPAAPAAPAAPAPAATTAAAPSPRPLLPPGIDEHFLAPLRGGDGLRYRPSLGAFVDVAYRSARAGVDETRAVRVVVPFSDGPVPLDWERSELVELELDYLEDAPLDGASFAPLPPDASQARSYTAWGREVQRWIQANVPVTLLESKARKAISRPGESESEFRMRLADLRREARDAETDRIRKRFESRLSTLQERERRALQAVERRAGMARQRTLDAALRVGEGLLGAFMGRKTSAARTGTAVRSAGRVLRQRQEVAQAGETVEAVRAQAAQMEEEFAAELAKVEGEYRDAGPLEELQVRPTLTGMSVRLSTLLWLPHDGNGRALWR